MAAVKDLTATTVAPEEETKAKGFEPQIVTIAGEMVAFTPTGFPKGEPSIVQFDDYYKPEDMSISDAMILKNSLRQLFGSSSLPIYDSKLGKELPRTLKLPILPPCDIIQKTLVMRSLQYRFDLLRQELNIRGIRSYQDLRKRMEELKKSGVIASIEGQDTLDVRRNLQHFQALKNLMADYETSQQCFNLEDTAFGALELDLTDERARELLKQFIFFTLQAHHPLQEYKKTNPTAPAFVKRLEVNPLGETFPKFMTTYKGNKLPIPESIARVLESIGAEPGMLEDELKRRLAEAFAKEKEKIITFIYQFYPPGDTFWRTIGEEKDVYRIVEKLMERLREAEGEVQRLTAENESLKSKLSACESSKSTLQENVTRLTAQVTTLTTQLEAVGGKDDEITRLNAALSAATTENETKQRSLQETIDRLTGELSTNQARMLALSEQNEALLRDIAALRTEVAALKEAEAALRSNLEEVRRGYEAQIEQEKGKTIAETSAKVAAIEARDVTAAELAAAKAEIIGKDTALEANKQQILSLEKAVNDCNAETAKIQSELSAKTEEASILLREKTELTAQLTDTEARVAKLSDDLESSESDNTELREQIEELNETIQALRTELADKDAAWKRCEAEKDAMAKPADVLAQKAAQLEADLAEAQSKAEAAKAEKARFEADIVRLTEELKKRDLVIGELQEQMGQRNAELGSMTTRAQVAEGEAESTKGTLVKTSGELETERAKTIAQQEALLEKENQHAKQLGELTDSFKGQLADESGKTSTEKRRADTAEAKIGEITEDIERQGRAFQALKEAIATLVGMEKQTPESDITTAIDPIEDIDAKENLKDLYSKLLSGMSSPKGAEKAAEHMASQCQNMLLLSFLWQTNFPVGDTESQKFYEMVNTLFSSGPYPNKPGRTLPGVYKGDPLKAKEYLPLLKKLLTVFEFGNPAAAGSLRISTEEIESLKKLVAVMGPVELAYKEETGASPSFMINKARENMLRHQPTLEPLLPSYTLQLNEATSTVERVEGAEETKLSYSLLFYCFIIVLRDSLNQSSESLSRGGQCPLPQILTIPRLRRGSQ